MMLQTTYKAYIFCPNSFKGRVLWREAGPGPAPDFGVVLSFMVCEFEKGLFAPGWVDFSQIGLSVSQLFLWSKPPARLCVFRYVESKKDRVTVVFSTVFKDDDDVIIGKVFMQVRPCSFSSVPPRPGSSPIVLEHRQAELKQAWPSFIHGLWVRHLQYSLLYTEGQIYSPSSIEPLSPFKSPCADSGSLYWPPTSISVKDFTE